MGKIDGVIAQLKQINESSTYSFFVPSACSKINFRPISILQQQELLKTLSGNALDNIRTINAANSILLQNKIGDTTLRVTDRDMILLQYKMDDPFTSAEDKQKIRDGMNYAKSLLTAVYEVEKLGIRVLVEIPTLERDIKANNLYLEVASIKGKEFAEQIVELYSLQVVKFIRRITIGETVVEFDFETAEDFTNLQTIVDNIPTSINNEVLHLAKVFLDDPVKFITSLNLSSQSSIAPAA